MLAGRINAVKEVNFSQKQTKLAQRMMKRSIIVYQLVCSYFDANRESCVALLILHLNISECPSEKVIPSNVIQKSMTTTVFKLCSDQA